MNPDSSKYARGTEGNKTGALWFSGLRKPTGMDCVVLGAGFATPAHLVGALF
jgi:hypothetical protein